MLARIGRFEVERTLGSGSFATVWLARDEDLEAWVAIKLLAENWSFNEDARRRFLQEARALRRLDDDRIVRVYEVGRLPDDRPYMVMEYADRGSLEERMRLRAQLDQPYSVREAVALSVDLADCLASVHASRIVHRDVKPSNVLFKSVRTPRRDADGRTLGTVAAERTLLGDFGIIRSLEGVLGPTRIVGSPQYMAPEQADPELAGQVDERADLYSAAVILYELLAGRPPRPAPGTGTERTDAPRPEREPVAIGGLRRDVPDALAQTIHRGLARDRRERFATAEAWRESLLRSLEGGGQARGVVVDDDPPLFARAASPPPVAAPSVPTLPVPAEPSAGATAAAATERRTMLLEEDEASGHRPPSGGPEPTARRETVPATAGAPTGPVPATAGPTRPVPPRADLGSYPATAPDATTPVPAAPRPIATAPLHVPPPAPIRTLPAAQPVPGGSFPDQAPVVVGPGIGEGFRRARLGGAVAVLAGAGALAAAFVPFGADRAGAGLETRLASTSVTLAQAAALCGLFLVLAGWTIRHTYQRWAGRLLAVLVWLAGAGALVSGVVAGLSTALDGGRGPTLAPFVLAGAGLLAVVAAHLALRRFRRPVAPLPPLPPAQPVRPA